MSDQPSLFDDLASAEISPCGKYRYVLTRRIGDGPTVNWILLNPSTADAVSDDPTIRRLLGYALAWGMGRIVVTNLFAYRLTDSGKLRTVLLPVGPENDRHLIREAQAAALVVCGWGTKGAHLGRAEKVKTLLRGCGATLHALRLTKDGCPEHPLYLPGNLKPEAWDG
jgi:hypothetical protein